MKVYFLIMNQLLKNFPQKRSIYKTDVVVFAHGDGAGHSLPHVLELWANMSDCLPFFLSLFCLQILDRILLSDVCVFGDLRHLAFLKPEIPLGRGGGNAPVRRPFSLRWLDACRYACFRGTDCTNVGWATDRLVFGRFLVWRRSPGPSSLVASIDFQETLDGAWIRRNQWFASVVRSSTGPRLVVELCPQGHEVFEDLNCK